MAERDEQWARLLGLNPVFSPLSPTGRLRLARTGSSLSLDRGAYLCAMGDPGDAAYLVLSGEIEISVPAEDGRDLCLAREGPGAVLGEMALLDGEPRSADMVAVRRSTVLRLGRSALIQALHDEPEVAVTLLTMLARRVRSANARTEEASSLDLSGRLARLLLRETGPAVTCSQAELARRIGASRERVNRKLGEWRDLGWILKDERGVRLIDRSALAAIGQTDEANAPETISPPTMSSGSSDTGTVAPRQQRTQV